MITRIQKALRKLNREQKGQVLVLVLVFLLLGTLILTPLLAYMSTGLKTGQTYQKKTAELYAADAGTEDGLWQIKSNNIIKLTDTTSNVTYNPYDYTHIWSDPFSGQVNAHSPAVTIANVWIPTNIATPDPPIDKLHPSLAQSIIQSGKLIVSGSVSGSSTYQIKITYYPEGIDSPLQIQTLGVWLPAGFKYVTGSSNLELHQTDPYYAVAQSSDWDGGEAELWTFGQGTLFSSFPSVNATQIPMTSTITFQFTCQQAGAIPSAVSWITTRGVSNTGTAHDIPFSWDADTRIFHITSIVDNTTVETYTAKNELRQLQSSIAGDYYATGNSNLSDEDGDRCRETWHDPSSAAITTSNIPSDADVAAAYLYWTGWKNDNSAILVPPLSPDKCTNFANWIADSAWDYTTNNGKFTGYTSAGRTGANLTLINSLDLSPYASGLVTISWDQSIHGSIASGDGLDFALSMDGGISYSGKITAFRGPSSPSGSYRYNIPSQYLTSGLFKIQFYLVGFSSSSKNCQLDNIQISAMLPDTSVVFTIDDGSGSGAKQVYLDGNGTAQQGTQELTASKSQVVENFSGGTTPHGFSYSSFQDVTSLVRKYSQAPAGSATNWPGYGTYAVGGISADASPKDEWAYACWSLVIIYTSPNTQGHQLYLYDKFTYSNQDTQNGVNVDFDHDGQPGGNISGFIVPSQINGEITSVQVNNNGTGYTSPPVVIFTGGGGSGAIAKAIVSGGKVTSIPIVSSGSGYTSAPTVSLTGGGGTGAQATATIDNEVNAGKITTFVGEGDVWYTGDYVALNGTKLWDGVNCTDNSISNPDNVFNSTSLGLTTHDGIDIDTLGKDPGNGQYITWASNLLKPGDTSAHIDMVTHTDVWNLVYIIISFRSATTTGGDLSFLIH